MSSLRIDLKILGTLCLVSACGAGCARFEEKVISPAAVSQALETRSLADPSFRIFLETNTGVVFPAWPLTNFDFSALTLTAFYFHPDLDVARAQWAVARGGEAVAATRPNPILGLTPGYTANPPGGVSPWFPSVTLDVPIETAGKRRHRLAQAKHLSEAARLNISKAAWQVRRDVRMALTSYVIAQHRSELLSNQVFLAQQVTELLEQRKAAGVASASEVSPSRIALIELQAQLADARRVWTEAHGKIAGAIGLPARAIDGVEFSHDLSSTSEAELLSTDARREALVRRADILAALAEYAASQSALQLEIAKQYPDLHFNSGYQFDQGENKWQLGLSMELPVFSRNQGGIKEAVARREEQAARFLALQARVISEIDGALLAWSSATEQVKRSNEFVRARQEQFERVADAFQAGAVDQFELATARLEATATEVSRLEALARKQEAIGLLEDALQRPFEGSATIEHDPKLQTTQER